MLAFHLCNTMSGKGVILCIEKALEDAGATKEDINYINAHATSTQMGDLKEFEALNQCFGQNPQAFSCFQKYSILRFSVLKSFLLS
jgi:3-oxoacyl-(acyl-carrier-protein) synthase